ncbi:hypothetical protein QEJ31_00015 [Pigmentibacter sp. JX0631]|uniref:hypothetical protein n=1 Tax=Pigmentibacter sp. JX0631 TaxID=2976982 RepID=UPI002468ED85|nr:hypothetical protein [Pigmentibacter sp. JX0631]WGL59986.1 hypothetical protein QEJ31_00015 [Pigmentibacter sp. JX0631]
MEETLYLGILSLTGSNFSLQYLENFFEFYNKKKSKEGLKNKINIILHSVAENYLKFEESEIRKEIIKCLNDFRLINVYHLIIPSSEMFVFKDLFLSNSNAKLDFYFSVIESVNVIKNSSLKKVAIISTGNSFENKVFQDQLDGLNVQYFCNDNLLEMINEVIICSKQSGINAHVNRVFNNILAYLSLNQCDSILIDNFDIRKIFQINKAKTHLKILDTFDILNEQVLKSLLFMKNSENYKTAL